MTSDLTADTAIELSKNADTLLQATVERKLSPKAARERNRTYLRDEVQPLLDQADPFHITHNVLRRIERRGLSVKRGLSFRANMMEMSEARRLDVLRPSWALDTKHSAYAFLDKLGVRRPQSDSRAYTFAEVPRQVPSVIKATKATGSRGCYLIFSDEKIVHVRDRETFSSWEELEAHAQALMNPGVKGARGIADSWMVEELVLEDSANDIPARDLKFYCFYGEVLLVRESTRYPDPKVCFYTPDNERTDTGRDEDEGYEGLGVTSEQLDLVSEVSRSIPHPFMRIDMLNGEKELVFGEFTPRPGNFDQFNSTWDRLMGEAWARAESRILEDLLRGKKFDAYLSSTGLLEK